MDVFGKSGLETALILVGLGLLILIMLRRTYRYLGRQKRGDTVIVRTDRPPRETRASPLDAPDDVLRWEVQMHETARELSAQLDSKMRALQAVIAEADRAAARLEAAVAELPDAAEPTVRPSDQADALRPTVGAAVELPPQPATVETSSTDVSDRPRAQEHQEEIYTLADYGLDPGAIASRVGSPIGEVQLILRLRKRH